MVTLIESAVKIPDDYVLLDTGYGVDGKDDAVKKYQDKGYEVKSRFVKTDTPYLKMWEVWGKK